MSLYILLIGEKIIMKDVFISCPHCGRQYLPAEIYYPNEFFGRPHDIDRLNGLKIESYLGQSMKLDEDYECDNCLRKFRVTAKIQFKVDALSKYDMSKAYVTNLFDDKITLDENQAQ